MKNSKFKVSLLSSLICISLYSYGDDYFDPSMLENQLGIDPSQVDLSQFSSSNSIPQGDYRFQVDMNNNMLGDMNISFAPNADGNVVPVFTLKLLEELGVNVKALPQFKNVKADDRILDLKKFIPDATVRTDMSKLLLTVTVPQVSMTNQYQGAIDPSLLDDGIPALFFNYFLSGNKSRNKVKNVGTTKSDNMFANVGGGLNLGPWRLRSSMTYSHSSGDYGSQSTTEFNNTYIMRALHSIRSTFMVGEVYTGNEIFDSIPFKGIKLSSSDDMLPSSQRGYAPEVNGIASSNARITIRQNGSIVYQTYVAPGPFNLKDVYASGNAGDLDVTITEEDGTEKTFTIAYSSLPVMLRPGNYRYETSAGRYNGGYTVRTKESDFFLGSFAYGLPTNSTLYGGLLMAKDYFSAAAGVGVSLGTFGALSADITHATADMGGELGDKSGQSFRVRYSKSMMSTGTSIDLTALRYSSRTFFSFSDFNTYDQRLKDDVAPWLNQRQRASFTTSISQSIGKYGSIFLSGSITDYWEIDREVKQVAMGYTGTWNRINYSIRYSIDRIKDDKKWPENKQISLNVSVPFSLFSNHELAREMSSSYLITHDNRHRTSQQLSINGSALDNKLGFGIYQSYENKGVGNSGGISTNYSGSKGNTAIGYSYGKDSQNINGSFSGGALIHSGGVILGNTMGNSMAVIEALGADGAKTNNQDTVINGQGYALYPYVSPYNANNISMDVNTLPNDVMLKETSKTVYPSAGAVVKVKFNTKLGYQVIINLKSMKGKGIPFGAIATLLEDNADEVNTGIVGDNNQLFMSGLPSSGKLSISWGNGIDQKCIASFSGLDTQKIDESQPIRTISASCQ